MDEKQANKMFQTPSIGDRQKHTKQLYLCPYKTRINNKTPSCTKGSFYGATKAKARVHRTL